MGEGKNETVRDLGEGHELNNLNTSSNTAFPDLLHLLAAPLSIRCFFAQSIFSNAFIRSVMECACPWLPGPARSHLAPLKAVESKAMKKIGQNGQEDEVQGPPPLGLS